ncbi:MAG: hypothetical protein OXF74_05465 [Rhodobacteraceae bacterium]|nr:hypothetical protein [Paracoccaceae bacterium]
MNCDRLRTEFETRPDIVPIVERARDARTEREYRDALAELDIRWEAFKADRRHGTPRETPRQNPAIPLGALTAGIRDDLAAADSIRKQMGQLQREMDETFVRLRDAVVRLADQAESGR